jgi:hypothetical protein
MFPGSFEVSKGRTTSNHSTTQRNIPLGTPLTGGTSTVDGETYGQACRIHLDAGRARVGRGREERGAQIIR